MKKVLVVGFTENPGGIENVVMNYYRNFDRKEVQLDFLYSTDSIAFEKEINDMGGKTYHICSKHSNMFKHKKELKEFFKEHANEYSSIWVNFCNITNLDYFKLAKKYGINKRIIHAHNSQNMGSKLKGILHKINKLFIASYATDYWSCSDDASDWFYTKKIRDKVLVVKNSIDLDRFKYDSNTDKKYRKELNTENKFVIGNVGRLHFQKNQMFLLDVFNEIKKVEPNAELLLVGEGEDREKITNKINELGLNDSVQMLGARDDVPALMSSMDVFLFPSVFEGLGLVLVEAEAIGLPIVAASDDIPHEVKMSSNFTFVSLNDSLDKWRDEVLKFKNTKKEDNTKSLQENGYDIKLEVKKIQELL
ncbi:MAG: glycosyltransferase family 1 protein [Bacilli bacterium]|nr:glycosyltransferase family 1 protein [Bacilli bacterium]